MHRYAQLYQGISSDLRSAVDELVGSPGWL